MDLREQIVSCVEKSSGYLEHDFSKWEKQKFHADGLLVNQFWDYVEKADEIYIVGDYDVDGVCASYILMKSILSVFPSKKLGIKIPFRFSEGYGISSSIVEKIKNKIKPGALIITVDNGITAKSYLEDLESCGYTVIVTDHHVLPSADDIPNVSLVINPKAGSASSLSGDYWCGSGVVLKLVEQYIPDTVKKDCEVFAAIATIADCVPLVEGNWALVKKAIKRIRRYIMPVQILFLFEALGKDPAFCNEDTIGYYLAPAINAPGRLYDNGGACIIRYFKNPSIDSAKEIIDINTERRCIREGQFRMAEAYIAENHLEDSCPIWVRLDGLHEGIIGIIAGEIAEKYNVPAIVLTSNPSGLLKGSARSVPSINIINLLSKCGAEFESLGGHAGAAGMVISQKQFEIARLYQCGHPEEPEQAVCPIRIRTENIPDALDILAEFEPFGEGNPAPVFSTIIDYEVDIIRICGSQNTHLIAQDSKNTWNATHFNHFPNGLKDQNRFVLEGTIQFNGFKSVGMPTLNGHTAYDYDDEEFGDLSRDKE